MKPTPTRTSPSPSLPPSSPGAPAAPPPSIRRTRRRFLRLAAAGGLLTPFFDQLEALASTGTPQRRVAFVFFPHGTPNTSGYWPGAGPLGTLTGVLAPLAAHKDRMLIVGGLGSGLEKGYGHNGGNTAVLTGRGSSDKDGGFFIPKSPSADWLIARHLKQEPLVLGQRVSSGARLLISFSEPSKAGAVTPVNDVGEAFKRVFGRAANAGMCTTSGGLAPPPANQAPPPGGSPAVLDVVAQDLKALKAELPSFSRTVLDDQLDAINDLHLKAKEAAAAAAMGPAKPPTMSTAGTGGTSEGCYAAGTSDFGLRSNYMADLIVAAFQSGARRVATFQQGTASGDSFSVPGFGGYHGEVHNLNSGAVGDLTRVTNMQVKLFESIGYFVDRLAATKDLSGQPLIDSTLVYICTEFSPYAMTSDPHNTGSNLVVNLIGASNTFDTTGKAITVKAGVGTVLVAAAQYMGLSLGAGLGAEDLGRFMPAPGVLKG
jgi:hypothetical protein